MEVLPINVLIDVCRHLGHKDVHNLQFTNRNVYQLLSRVRQHLPKCWINLRIVQHDQDEFRFWISIDRNSRCASGPSCSKSCTRRIEVQEIPGSSITSDDIEEQIRIWFWTDSQDPNYATTPWRIKCHSLCDVLPHVLEQILPKANLWELTAWGLRNEHFSTMASHMRRNCTVVEKFSLHFSNSDPVSPKNILRVMNSYNQSAVAACLLYFLRTDDIPPGLLTRPEIQNSKTVGIYCAGYGNTYDSKPFLVHYSDLLALKAKHLRILHRIDMTEEGCIAIIQATLKGSLNIKRADGGWSIACDVSKIDPENVMRHFQHREKRLIIESYTTILQTVYIVDVSEKKSVNICWTDSSFCIDVNLFEKYALAGYRYHFE